jgi:hypothetical protein
MTGVEKCAAAWRRQDRRSIRDTSRRRAAISSSLPQMKPVTSSTTISDAAAGNRHRRSTGHVESPVVKSHTSWPAAVSPRAS